MSELLSILARSTEHAWLGRLGGDPSTKFFESGSAVTNANFAVSRLGSKKGDDIPPDWFKLELWGEEGQTFADQCKKGDLIRVYGRIKSRQWTDKNGENKTDLIIEVSDWDKAASKKSATNAPAFQSSQPAPSDEEVPF